MTPDERYYKYYVYRHIRLDTEQPFYVGCGSCSTYKGHDRTWFHRAYAKKGRSPQWLAIINQTEYEVEIIFQCDDKETAIKKEAEFIKLYGRIDIGTGTLVNQSDSCDGNFSPQRLRLLSKIHKGRRVAEEVRDRISKSQIGKKMPESHREKMREIKKGSRLPDGATEKASEKRQIPVVQLDLSGNKIKEYSRITFAAIELGCDRGDISKCCKGRKKTTAGFKWMYLSEYNAYLQTLTS